jgi:hypothetical protein
MIKFSPGEKSLCIAEKNEKGKPREWRIRGMALSRKGKGGSS